MFHGILLVLALSMDSLLAALAYALRGIRIPLTSALIIAVVSAGFLGLSFLSAFALSTLISPQAAAVLSAVMFAGLSLYSFFQSSLKRMLRHAARRLLMEMQARYIAVCDENALLKMQVHEFEDILYLARNLVFDGSCYWLVAGGIKQGPFCPRCYNREGALIRLDAEDTGDGKWRCATCGTVIDREYAQAPLPPSLARRSAKVLSFNGGSRGVS